MECWATLSRTGCREGRQGSLTGPGHVGSGPGRVRELGYSHTRRACRTVAISTLGNYLGESVARVAVVQLAERGSRADGEPVLLAACDSNTATASFCIVARC